MQNHLSRKKFLSAFLSIMVLLLPPCSRPKVRPQPPAAKSSMKYSGETIWC